MTSPITIKTFFFAHHLSYLKLNTLKDSWFLDAEYRFSSPFHLLYIRCCFLASSSPTSLAPSAQTQRRKVWAGEGLWALSLGHPKPQEGTTRMVSGCEIFVNMGTCRLAPHVRAQLSRRVLGFIHL